MNKKNIKIAIILVAVMFAYFIAILIIASSRNSKAEEKEKEKTPVKEPVIEEPPEEIPEVTEGDYTLIFDDKIYLSYKDRVWYEYKDFEYVNRLVDVYIDNSLFGNYFLGYGDRWSIYDADRDFKDYDGDFMGVYSNIENPDIRVLNVQASDFNSEDDSTMINYLNDKGLTFDYNDIIKIKYIIDVDRDGLRDTIYFVTNAFTDSTNSYTKAFAYAFVKYANNKEETFYNYEENMDSILTMASPSLQTVVEIDGYYYFIVKKSFYSDDVKYSAYSLLDGSILLEWEME